MAANLGFVTHAAQRHAHELAVGRTRNGLTQRGLAHTRRPHQAQDRRLDLIDALLHREVFENAFLDLFQAVVILVQHRSALARSLLILVFFFHGRPTSTSM